MVQIISLPNYNSNNLVANTRLTADTAGGGTVSTFNVQNVADFNVGDYIILGTPGAETTELLVISSTNPDGPTITTTAPAILAHTQYDYVTSLYGSQVKLYRAANVTGLQPDDSTFASLGSPVAMQVDQQQTQVSDAAGGNGYWYKFTYYNPTNSNESNLSDSKAVRGGESGNYCTLQQIRKRSGFQNAPYVTDDMIDEHRQSAQDEINSTLQGFYNVPFQQPINAFIQDICVRLASGFLLVDQFGATNTLNTADGNDKIKGARADLLKLATKQLELTDENGSSLAEAGSTGGVSSWPDSTTATADVDSGGAPRVFRMGDIQGYFGQRRY